MPTVKVCCRNRVRSSIGSLIFDSHQINPKTESINTTVPARIGTDVHPAVDPFERVNRKTIIIEVDSPAPIQSNELSRVSFTLNRDGSRKMIAPPKAIMHRGRFIQKTHSHPA